MDGPALHAGSSAREHHSYRDTVLLEEKKENEKEKEKENGRELTSWSVLRRSINMKSVPGFCPSWNHWRSSVRGIDAGGDLGGDRRCAMQAWCWGMMDRS